MGSACSRALPTSAMHAVSREMRSASSAAAAAPPPTTRGELFVYFFYGFRDFWV